MAADNSILFSPADLPRDAVLAIVGPTTGMAEAVIGTVRPDVSFAPGGTPLVVDPALAMAPPAGALVFPQVATSYYDFWSFPLGLLETVDSVLGVRRERLVEFVSGFGGFFGAMDDGRWTDEPQRYRAFDGWRADPQTRARADALLGDEASREDLRMVLDEGAPVLWAHWLSGLFNGLEYMDYVSVSPGDVVVNCGVHGGGEAPFFLAAMQGRGTLVNIDPLGMDYVQPQARAAMAAFAGDIHEVRAALHDREGTIDLPVEPGGMAAGGRPGEVLEGLETITFQATTLDEITRRLDLRRMDLVKMDIEGAEIAALDGAWAALRRFRPQLAISIYHEPSHFTGIPLRIAQELPDYRFFVRNYHFISNETILYAIPQERPVKPRNKEIPIRLLNA